MPPKNRTEGAEPRWGQGGAGKGGAPRGLPPAGQPRALPAAAPPPRLRLTPSPCSLPGFTGTVLSAAPTVTASSHSSTPFVPLPHPRQPRPPFGAVGERAGPSQVVRGSEVAAEDAGSRGHWGGGSWGGTTPPWRTSLPPADLEREVRLNWIPGQPGQRQEWTRDALGGPTCTSQAPGGQGGGPGPHRPWCRALACGLNVWWVGEPLALPCCLFLGPSRLGTAPKTRQLSRVQSSQTGPSHAQRACNDPALLTPTSERLKAPPPQLPWMARAGV